MLTHGRSLRSRTLQPHLFIFTAVSVKAGQEVLLDYGEVSRIFPRASLMTLSAIKDKLKVFIGLEHAVYWRHILRCFQAVVCSVVAVQ